MISFLLDALKEPLEKSVPPTQAGSRKGYTTSSHALSHWSHSVWAVAARKVLCMSVGHSQGIPHPSILEALCIIGTHPNLRNIIASVYHSSSKRYRDFQYPLRWGIKEGCPIPSLSILVNEAFNRSLIGEFRTARFFVYVDDIAIITPDKATPHKVLHRTHEPLFATGKQWLHCMFYFGHWCSF